MLSYICISFMLDTKYVPLLRELTGLKARDNRGRNAEEHVAKPYACVLDLLSQAASTNLYNK
jgi:hypothetical protein